MLLELRAETASEVTSGSSESPRHDTRSHT